MTTITTTNPVRSDVVEEQAPARTRQSRLWAVIGIGAALAGVGTIITSSAVSAVYDPSLTTPEQIMAKLETQAGWMFALHSVTVVGALLMLVFGAGLHRRLRAALPADSSLPLLAFAGMLGTAVVSILGSGLDTEFMLALAAGDGTVEASSAIMYNHWIGTIPWLWTLAGVTGVSVFLAARARAVPRWLGIVGLVMGGLTLLAGISPFEYMAGPVAVLWLLVTAVGFTAGDKAFRNA
ncbi:hypothetical protein AVL62_02210 [Serinicoccus chungangensis]|uniref:DUF4386 domain-containing protein n=1 Tax=Serinicoccus chungangensis TaxID=767452 RepID=A0A0W8I5S5_9MICO|nr:hypothetical protein [Serinicoccus chungangensis]KUG53616.1 hypothetical protein AVL62_02210 [Serinicoccus chungangensis]